jgi:hypothetical protein
MKRMKAIVLSLAVLFALRGFALARDDHDRDDRGKNGYQAGYSRGYHAGQDAGRSDRGHARRDEGRINDTDGYSHNVGSQGQYKKGYREGYRKGYDEAYNSRRDWDHDRDRDRDHDGEDDRDWHHGRNDGGWNRNQRTDDVAHRTGYQDGFNVGQQDKWGGHSYRPHEHDQTYGNADHNYSQVGGDKNAYKARYREGFEQGYREGYYKR